MRFSQYYKQNTSSTSAGEAGHQYTVSEGAQPEAPRPKPRRVKALSGQVCVHV